MICEQDEEFFSQVFLYVDKTKGRRLEYQVKPEEEEDEDENQDIGVVYLRLFYGTRI